MKRRNPLILVGGFALLGLLAAALLFRPDWFGLGQDVTEPEAASDFTSLPAPEKPEIAIVRDGLGGIAVGSPAPDFTLQNLAGDEVALSSFAGRPVMINFWASWCAPCRIEMPEIEAIYQERQDEGLVILALNQDEDADTVREYFAALQLSFDPLLDMDLKVAEEYGVAGIYPTSYFIAPDGTVSGVHRGPATLDQIKGYLDAMSATQG